MHAVGRQLRGTADVRRDDGGAHGHRFQDRVRRPFVLGRLDEQIERVVQIGDVEPVSRQNTRRVESEPGHERGQLAAKAAVADDHETQVGTGAGEWRERFEQQVETLLALEPADGAHDEVVRLQTEVAAHVREEVALIPLVQLEVAMLRARDARELRRDDLVGASGDAEGVRTKRRRPAVDGAQNRTAVESSR